MARSLEKEIRRLAELRIARSELIDAGPFAELRLAPEGISVARLNDLLDEIEPAIAEASRIKRAAFEAATGNRDYYPWDAEFADTISAPAPDSAFTRAEMLPAVIAGVRRWGFRGSALRFRVDTHDLPVGGISIPVDPPEDVRVIVHPSADWTQYMILFHEVGHTVQSRCNSPQPPLLRWYDYVPGFFGFVEGMGTLFEEIPRSADWIATRPGLTSAAAERFAGVQELSNLARMAGLVARVRVELALYENPQRDLDSLQYRIHRRLGAFDPFTPACFADPFLADYPMYLQSYVLANLFAKQVLESMLAQEGGPTWPNRRFAAWLVRHWFRRSGELDWPTQLRSVTGQPLRSTAYRRAARAIIRKARHL